MADEKNLEGLGGWLVLVGLGIVVSPLRLLALVIPLYSGILSDGTWTALTTPGNAAYHHLWLPILLGEVVINMALVLLWVFIAFLFFSKKAAFPKWYASALAFSLAFIVIDAFAIKLVLPAEPIFDPDTAREATRALIASIIWIPYMFVSKRVKATFVN